MPDIADLSPLVGRWEFVVDHEAFDPPPTGETTFEWLRDEKVLLQRSTTSDPAFPESVSLVMAEEGRDSFAMRYFDSRAVTRVYDLTFEDGVLKYWREASGLDDFDQRFEGRLSEDGQTIHAELHRTEDGAWIHDFDVTYTRAGA